MKKGWNRCPTQIRLQGGMDLLGVARKAMERSFLVLVEWCHQCPGHSVPPNTTRSTRQAFSVRRRPSTSISSETRTSHGKRMRERTNRESYPSKKHQEADVSPKTRHVLEDPSGDGYRRPLSTKKSPKKPINRMCPCEESTDERIEGQPLGQGRLMVQGILPGEGCDVKSTWFRLTSWGPVTEARQLPVHGNTPWNESLLQYHSPLGKSHHQTLSPLWWRCDPIQTKPLL